MLWDIYSIGNSAYLAAILNAVAMVAGTADLRTLAAARRTPAPRRSNAWAWWPCSVARRSGVGSVGKLYQGNGKIMLPIVTHTRLFLYYFPPISDGNPRTSFRMRK